jgi:hypothetical protein
MAARPCRICTSWNPLPKQLSRKGRDTPFSTTWGKRRISTCAPSTDLANQSLKKRFRMQVSRLGACPAGTGSSCCGAAALANPRRLGVDTQGPKFAAHAPASCGTPHSFGYAETILKALVAPESFGCCRIEIRLRAMRVQKTFPKFWNRTEQRDRQFQPQPPSRRRSTSSRRLSSQNQVILLKKCGKRGTQVLIGQRFAA